MADPRLVTHGTRRIRIATYNVHSCVGTDGRRDPDRIARVIDELEADVVALQEMTYSADLAIETRSPVVLPVLSKYEHALGPTHTRADGQFGNMLLSRFPIRDLSRIDLSEKRREPRGALHVELDAFGSELHVIATHLGLHPRERRLQIERIVATVRGLSAECFAVLGDFNDWLPGRSLVRVLDEVVGSAGSPRSFPSRWPVLALDRIWIHPRPRVHSVRVHRSAEARRASDHLPVIAELDITVAAASMPAQHVG